MNFSIRVAMKTILGQLKDGSRGAAENVIVSPASLDIVLRTAACGAKGRTLEQMLSFLGAKDINDLNSKASSTMEVLRLASPENIPPPEIKSYGHRMPAIVSCANAIWVDERRSVKDSFKKLLNDVYRAEANNVDFLNKTEEAVKEINSWAKKSTNGRIDNVLTPKDINNETSLVLTNAIYFKALWSRPFGSISNKEDFHLIDGIDKVSVPCMYKGYERFSYGKFDGFKVLELPYQTGRPYGERDEGPCFSMYIFLPHKVDGLPEMVSKFGESNPIEALSQTLGGLEEVEMKKVVIPKWKSSYKFEPKDTMEKLGLTLPFDIECEDFTEMLVLPKDWNVYIDKVIQSSYIDVDEKGTEAAAVTAMVMCFGCCPRPPKASEEFVADHPFMFMIVERNSKTVIFAGAVFNPLDQQQQ